MLKTTKRNRYLTDLGVKYHLTNWFALEGRLRWDEAVNRLEDNDTLQRLISSLIRLTDIIVIAR